MLRAADVAPPTSSLAKMATDVLSVVWGLAMKVKEAHDGVQGNKEQCKVLNDHVQNVAKALKGLPSATRQKEEVQGALRKLVETLRSAADLIVGFKKQNWFTKMVKQSSMAEKFAELFRELDSTLHVCGFAVEVREADNREIHDVLPPRSSLFMT